MTQSSRYSRTSKYAALSGAIARTAIGLDTGSIARAALGLDSSALTRRVNDVATDIDVELSSRPVGDEVEMWWTALPYDLRVAVIVTVVWMCVFLRLGTLSTEHADASRFLQDPTGATPFVLATASAWAARAIYRRFSGRSEEER